MGREDKQNKFAIKRFQFHPFGTTFGASEAPGHGASVYDGLRVDFEIGPAKKIEIWAGPGRPRATRGRPGRPRATRGRPGATRNSKIPKSPNSKIKNSKKFKIPKGQNFKKFKIHEIQNSRSKFPKVQNPQICKILL